MTSSKTLEQLSFDNSYARLPEIFHSAHQIQPLENQHLIHFNNDIAELLELDKTQASRDDFVDLITGVQPLPGSMPIAACYAGHQFGTLVHRLGDGRAMQLGEVVNSEGQRWDLNLKGAGPTKYSRGADGRAVLRSSIREYLCSAAMHGLGIGTTHALCLIGSTEKVFRERSEPGAMVLRVAPSHIRFGTFEYYYYQQRFDDLKILADYTLETHFPDLLDNDNPYLALLGNVIESTAELMADWQAVGFAHGVMNSDNMSIHGITLDYGPFGFLDEFNPGFICNHSDHSGRYAFAQQPQIALFNTSCLAQAMLPLFDEDLERGAEAASEELGTFQAQFEARFLDKMRQKLGLEVEHKQDQELINLLLKAMAEQRADYTLTFRALCDIGVEPQASETLTALFKDPAGINSWLDLYQLRLEKETVDANARRESMRQRNPQFILRNYLAENAIRKAEDQQDYAEIERLMRVLRNPYSDHPEDMDLAATPPDWAAGISVSCSS